MRHPFSFWKPASAGSATTVSAISPVIGDILGGDTVTLTVGSSVGCTSATVGGVALTSFSIVDGTHVSGVTGAHAAGTGLTATVTNAYGTSAAGGTYQYYDPTTLFDFYADDIGAAAVTWTVRKGSNLTNANPPTFVATAGAARAYYDFDGTNDLFTGAATNSYVTTSAWTSFTLFNYDAISTTKAEALTYENDGLWCDTGGYVGCHLDSTGPEFQAYGDGSPGVIRRDVKTIGASGSWIGSIGKYDGTSVYARLGSGAWSAGRACPSPIVDALAGVLRVGANYTTTGYFDGKMGILALSKNVIADVDLTTFIAYVNARRGLSL